MEDDVYTKNVIYEIVTSVSINACLVMHNPICVSLFSFFLLILCLALFYSFYICLCVFSFLLLFYYFLKLSECFQVPVYLIISRIVRLCCERLDS